MSRSKSIHFFATKSDLEPVIVAVESQRALIYTQAGMFDAPETNTFASGTQLPNLGFAPSGEHGFEPFWLIVDADKEVQVEVVSQRRGGSRYCIDQRLNPESIVIWTGGVFENSCIVAGQIGTAIFNKTSLELLNLFVRELRGQFERIKAFYVGPEAERLLDAGYRLTHGVGTARTSDLSRM
jgi:hypothetical protein